MDIEKELLSGQVIETTYLYCYKKLGNSADSEDLAQEILLEAVNSLRQGREIHSFYSWYWQMAHNKYCDFLKKSRGHAISLDVFGGSLPSDMPPLYDSLIRSEEISELNLAISRLSKIHREIIIMFYLKEFGIGKIAKNLGIPEGTVKRRLFDAKQNIRKGMEKNMSGTGKLSYAPADVNLWGGYKMPNYWGKIDDIMVKQIFAACSKKASTIQEISDEIGVAPLYMQDKLDYLIENKFLKEAGRGKYIIDFLLFPAQDYADYTKANNETLTQLGRKMTDVIFDVRESVTNQKFYGNDFDYGYLMWVLYCFASEQFHDTAKKIYEDLCKDEIKEKYSKDYILMGTITYPDENIVYPTINAVDWSNLHSQFKTSGYSCVEYGNLFHMGLFGDRDDLINDKNVNTLMKVYDNPDSKLSGTEKEQVANFIARGLVKIKDGGYYLTVPVMTYECAQMIRSIFREAVRSLVEEYVVKFIENGKKHLLPLVREDLLNQYINHGNNAAFFPINHSLYYGINAPDILEIPEDYSKSAAAICIYIKK